MKRMAAMTKAASAKWLAASKQNRIRNGIGEKKKMWRKQRMAHRQRMAATVAAIRARGNHEAHLEAKVAYQHQ